jgi:Cu2+-containing amine oxidase
VLRTIGLFGNYDYIFDWVFQQDGVIRVRARQAAHEAPGGGQS